MLRHVRNVPHDTICLERWCSAHVEDGTSGVTALLTNNLRVEEKPEGVRLLWFDVAGRSVNVFTQEVLADLEKAIAHVAADAAARVFVLRSEKPSGFMAGADLHEFTRIRNAEEA